jgi:putative transposase
MHKDRKANILHGYDYSRNALYFVTSCVQDRICYLGEIREDKMFSNEFGTIAEQQFGWLRQQYPYVDLHSFVVMPNHIHCIIEIDDRWVDPVGTGRDLSLQSQSQSQPQQEQNERPSIKIKSLSELMGAYKTTTSKKIHLAGLTDFVWQRSFHDHIIRNDESYLRISNYIRNNPLNWKDDTFNN